MITGATLSEGGTDDARRRTDRREVPIRAPRSETDTCAQRSILAQRKQRTATAHRVTRDRATVRVDLARDRTRSECGDRVQCGEQLRGTARRKIQRRVGVDRHDDEPMRGETPAHDRDRGLRGREAGRECNDTVQACGVRRIHRTATEAVASASVCVETANGPSAAMLADVGLGPCTCECAAAASITRQSPSTHFILICML